MTLHNRKRIRFLFVICHHFLNSTRSPTPRLSSFTDEKELNPNPRDLIEYNRTPPPGTSYIQIIDEFEVHAARPHVFAGSRTRGI